MAEFTTPLPTTFDDTQQLTDILKSKDSTLPSKELLDHVNMEHGSDTEHLGLVARADLFYSCSDNDLPKGTLRTVVVKMSPISPQRQGQASMLRLLEREVQFYHVLQPQIPKLQPNPDLRPTIPRCFYAAISGDKTQQLLVLEDMAPSKCGSIAFGRSANEAKAAVEELAKLHGVFFNQNMLAGLEWLLHTDGDLYRGLFAARLPSLLSSFKTRWKGEIKEEFVVLLDRLSNNVQEFMTQLGPKHSTNGDGSGKPCLFHGDFKSENIFFPQEDKGTVATVDFQTITQGSPLAAACDMAYFLFGCLESSVRTQEFTQELIRLYYEGLVKAIPKERLGNYSLDDCQKNCIRALNWPLIMMIYGGAQFPKDTATQVQLQRFKAFIHRLEEAALMYSDEL